MGTGDGQTPRRGDDFAYWKTKLSGELPNLALPLEHPRPAVLAYRAAVHRTPLSSLAELATSAGTTVEVVGLAIARLMLHVYTGQDDVIVGAGNLVAIRCAVDDRQSFAELLASVAACHAEAMQHATYPFDRLVEDLGIERDPQRTPVFQCRFEHAAAVSSDRTPYELVVRVIGSELELCYNAALLSERTVADMANVYAHLARQVTADPSVSIDALELVTAAQREELLGRFNDTQFSSGEQATICELFAASVRRFPGHRAVTCEGTSLTYAQLDRRVDALARHLVGNGLRVGEPVALLLEPSLHTVIAMLGVLRAGGIYLPIDPNLPVDRVRYLLDDSGAKFLIGGRDALGFGGQTIDVDAVDLERAEAAALPEVHARDGAYIIYTSGTTGKPKGVLIEHHSIVNYVTWFRSRYGVDDSHTAALVTSYAFDLGYTTLWTTILSGGHLHILPESLCEDVVSAVKYFGEHRVSFVKVTPSLLGAMISSKEFNRNNCGSLRLIVTGGERVRAGDIDAIYACCPDVLVVNHYGPTETTIGVMTYPVERALLPEFAVRPVIGRPIGNARAYITTRNLQLLPVGAPGELLIAGRGVGRGYYRRDDLTRAKFLPDPFAGSGNVYRTGDLARWTPEGTVEFLGRIDRQVKIRGYRIELSEIEQVIAHRLGTREVVVVDRIIGASNQVLCAYYVGDTPHDPAELRANLRQVLPEYMVPTYFIELPSLPRTENGKLDLARLPEPSLPAAEAAGDRSETDTERALVKLWSEVLGIAADSIGVTQNFFELGGHSLLMIQLIAEIDSHFGRTVEIPVFYREGTIRAIARLLDADGAS